MKKVINNLIKLTPATAKRFIPENFKKKIRIFLSPSSVPDLIVMNSQGSVENLQAKGNPISSKQSHIPGKIIDSPEYEYLSLEQYEEKWREFFGHRPDNYFAMHKRRYYELFNTFSYYYREMKKNSLILEIGVSEFLLFFKYFFPDIRLVTVDRPKENNGFESSYCIEKGGAERHYHIDLNLNDLTPKYGDPPLGHFDYIICTEVLEHLIVNPVDFIKSMLSLIATDGKLYLTTPNFFRQENLQKIANRINPQMIYPKRDGNLDAHHHFREFAMQELLGFIDEAGGKTIVHYFSNCWDVNDPLKPESHELPQQRSNLVLIIRQKLSLENY